MIVKDHLSASIGLTIFIIDRPTVVFYFGSFGYHLSQRSLAFVQVIFVQLHIIELNEGKVISQSIKEFVIN